MAHIVFVAVAEDSAQFEDAPEDFQEPVTTPLPDFLKEPAIYGWVNTSPVRTCEQNREGIVPDGYRSEVESADACRVACQGRADCVAVDFSPKEHICTFYTEACTTPAKQTPNAFNLPSSSSHLERRGSWVPIHEQRACATNDEGIKRIHHLGARTGTLEQCQASCLKRANCIAVDYYGQSGACAFFDEACEEPLMTGGGSQSWRLEVEKGSPGASVSEMKRIGNWEPIDEHQSCQKNSEGIKPDVTYEASNLDHCKQRCKRRAKCIAVDYYQRTGTCNLYSEACHRPMEKKDGSSSHMITRAGLKFHVIHTMAACEDNEQGVQFVASSRHTNHNRAHLVAGGDLKSCKRACARRIDCMAFDFFRETGECNLFHEACTIPLTQSDGASSYRLDRSLDRPITHADDL